jgi:hypothetical protein
MQSAGKQHDTLQSNMQQLNIWVVTHNIVLNYNSWVSGRCVL